MEVKWSARTAWADARESALRRGFTQGKGRSIILSKDRRVRQRWRRSRRGRRASERSRRGSEDLRGGDS